MAIVTSPSVFPSVGNARGLFCVLYKKTMSESDHSDENEIIEPIKSVSIAVQQGQRRRVMKGMTYNTDEKHGYIYLVRTREFKSLNRQVYKVGRTSQCPDTRITRLHKYTKGSEIYLILQCHVADVSLIEKESDISAKDLYCNDWLFNSFFEIQYFALKKNIYGRYWFSYCWIHNRHASIKILGIDG